MQLWLFRLACDHAATTCVSRLPRRGFRLNTFYLILALLRILALLTFCLSHFPIVVAHLVECQENTVTPEWSLITSQLLS